MPFQGELGTSKPDESSGPNEPKKGLPVRCVHTLPLFTPRWVHGFMDAPPPPSPIKNLLTFFFFFLNAVVPLRPLDSRLEGKGGPSKSVFPAVWRSPTVAQVWDGKV